MKKLAKILLLIVVCILVVGLFACDDNDISTDVVRIHIRANSNLEIDQNVKLKVRDEVTKLLTNELEGISKKGQALDKIKSLSDEIVEIANCVLLENDISYSSNIKIGKEHFPERKYGDYVFPEGDYDSVILNLGSGEGNNWWCVAFPPLCFSETDEVVYKSWVKEMLDKIFKK